MISWTEILKANKGLHARDSFSELWGLKLKAARAEIPDYTITGTLPLSFNSRVAGALKNYRLYGDSDGSGVQTENLFDKDATDTSKGYVAGAYLTSTGSEATSTNHFITEYISIPNGTTVIGCFTVSTNVRACFYDANKEFISSFVTGGVANVPQTAIYLRVSIAYSRINESMVLNNVSTAPTTYIPYGYKIPISLESGVTENLFDKDAKDTDNGYMASRQFNADGTASSKSGWYISEYIRIEPSTDYYLVRRDTTPYGTGYVCLYDSNKNFVRSIVLLSEDFTTASNETYIRFDSPVSLADTTMLCATSERPSKYIPHRYESNYDLFIGSTKLGEEEYVDFSEQKVYKDISGTLTPTDPPVPLPAIQAYQGENTLSSTETVGEVSITGKITEMA